jgi:phosphoglycerate dehydrogenase-like enzyme
MEDLLRSADFVVIAAPLTPDTHHLIGEPQLALMKPSAYLVNIARGPLVDEAALLPALEQGRIAGAGLDVWEEEPLRPDHPLLTLDNVIGTPHGLGATWESLQQVCEAIQANVLRVLAGQRPEHVINPEVFERRAV